MDNQDKKKPVIEIVPAEPLSDAEKAILLEKVSEKLKGKMVKMTDEELEEWNDPWRNHRLD